MISVGDRLQPTLYDARGEDATGRREIEHETEPPLPPRSGPPIVRAPAVQKEAIERPGWKLVWSDEFEVDGKPSAERWTAQLAAPKWVNGELQRYTASKKNAYVKNGQLHLVAYQIPRKRAQAGDVGLRPDGRLTDPHPLYEYTSARIHTEGKGDFRCGRIEVRAKLPRAAGSWPAIWMMPTAPKHGWPECGEIDIMEHVAFDLDVIHASLHSKAENWPSGNQRTNKVRIDGVTDAFHTYALERHPDRIEWYIDDRLIYRADRPEDATQANWPYDAPFHLILNVAVGGFWGGAEGVDTKAFAEPQEMVIDSVRIFERDTDRGVDSRSPR